MAIVTFASSKGGPGKTTAAACLASAWCAAGRSVAVIDADPTGALGRWVERGQEDGTVLARATLVQCVDDEAILERIRAEAGRHEYVVVDCAGAAARLLVYAAGAADIVVIPAQPGEADLVEAIKTGKIVEQASHLTGREIEWRVFLNRIDVRTHVGRHAVAQARGLGLPLFDTTFGDRVAFREGQYSGSTPMLLDPGSPAAHEIATFAREVEMCMEAQGAQTVEAAVMAGGQ